MFWELGTSGTRELGVWEWVWGFPGEVSLRSDPPAAAADCVGSAKVQFKQCTLCTFAGLPVGEIVGKGRKSVWYIAHRLSS